MKKNAAGVFSPRFNIAESQVIQIPSHKPAPSDNLPESVEELLDDVSFAYPNGKAALEHISFTAKRGECIAVEH